MTTLRIRTIAYGCLVLACNGCSVAASQPHAKHQHGAAAPSRAKACASVWPQYLQGVSSAAASADIQLSAAEIQDAHRDFTKKCMAEGPNSPRIVQVMQGSNRQDNVIDDILDALP